MKVSVIRGHSHKSLNQSQPIIYPYITVQTLQRPDTSGISLWLCVCLNSVILFLSLLCFHLKELISANGEATIHNKSNQKGGDSVKPKKGISICILENQPLQMATKNVNKHAKPNKR